jgi:heme exporter protein D
VNKLLVAVTVWTAASAAAAPLVGRLLRRNRQRHERLERLLGQMERDEQRERVP